MVAWKRLGLWLYNPLALRTAARREHADKAITMRRWWPAGARPPPPYSYYTILSFHLAAQPELYDYYFHTFNFHIRGCRPPAAIDSSCRS